MGDIFITTHDAEHVAFNDSAKCGLNNPVIKEDKQIV